MLTGTQTSFLLCEYKANSDLVSQWYDIHQRCLRTDVADRLDVASCGRFRHTPVAATFLVAGYESGNLRGCRSTRW